VLRVSIHAGSLANISRFNRLDWLDIGYQKLKREADYKVVLFKIGEGVTPPVSLAGYPRWSGSVWDLVARAIALALSADLGQPEERAQPVHPGGKRHAFAEAVSAVIQHIPNDSVGVRQLGSIEILHDEFSDAVYGTQIEEEFLPSRTLDPFLFAPKFLRPAELVMRAALMGLNGNIDKLPPRPSLMKPPTELISGHPYVMAEQLPEPARTGFRHWLFRRAKPPLEKPFDVTGEAVPLPVFEEFQDCAV
jgi:hypothetical protein